MRIHKLLGLVFAIFALNLEQSDAVPVFGNNEPRWNRADVESLPTNPPPAPIRQISTEPTVYLGDAIAPTGGYRVYTGFAVGTLSRRQLVEGDLNVGKELFLIGVGAAPTLKYNEINVTDGDTVGAFKATLINYFVFPAGYVERVTQIIIAQPALDSFLPLEPLNVLALIRNPIASNFLSVGPVSSPSNPVGAPPGTVDPPPRPSNVHALIISQGFGVQNAFKPYGPANLVGGIVAIGSLEKEAPLPSAAWSQNLTVLPDQELINGTKIPPITPNIVDVRIRHYYSKSTMESQSPQSP